MITVILKKNNLVTTYNFESLSEALVFARSKEVGTSFQIREESILLAKGSIKELKDFNYE